MNSSIREKRDFLRGGGHHAHRREVDFPPATRFAKDHLPAPLRVSRAFRDMLAAETPLIFPGDRILFWRTVSNLPAIFTPREWERIAADHFIHEVGRVCNICPNYEYTIAHGLLHQQARAKSGLAAAKDEQQRTFYGSAVEGIDALLDLCQRYRQSALEMGHQEGAALLYRVPAHGATTFHEALQSLRILQFALWCEGEYHNTLGRFDQFMYPYLRDDLDAGRLTQSEAQELLLEFFLSLNRDSDLYPGIQQGDNGQSLMLGGVDKDGKDCFNLLSEMCLEASRELLLIDPKINLRVHKNTPPSVYEMGTQLTREGLGFPQYSNDDIVIPALVDRGYALVDARNYTVAACWEFIIPHLGMDIPNIGAINLPLLVNEAALASLPACEDFPSFLLCVQARLADACAALLETTNNLYMIPAPFLSVLMDGCLDQGRDISLGAKYNHFGFHGVGLSSAVDSLYSIKRLIYEDGSLAIPDALSILREGFAGREHILAMICHDLPKFGDDVDDVDSLAVWLCEAFGAATAPLHNGRGGGVRAGTGSAMYYLWFAKDLIATLGGHQSGDALSANYAPQLFVKSPGPLSAIRSFTKPNLKNTPNGGPFTMEFHQNTFRGEDSLQKVAALVRLFIRNGGHQIQLNTVNRNALLDAKLHPENHKNLIVRIWGWSAYFVELDTEYQDHVIARQTFEV